MTFATIMSDARKQVGQNSTNWTDANLTIDINNGLDELLGIVLSADGRWQFDGTNYTDLPIATTDIVSGQSDYAFNNSFLKVLKVLVKDTNGDWQLISPIDTRDIESGELLKGASTNVGVPNKYDKFGNSVFLDPTPNYASSAGLKVYFQRAMKYLGDGTGVTLATTATPDFNYPSAHKFLSLYAQREWLEKTEVGSNHYQKVAKRLDVLKEEIRDHYSNRSADEQKNLRTVYARSSFE